MEFEKTYKLDYCDWYSTEEFKILNDELHRLFTEVKNCLIKKTDEDDVVAIKKLKKQNIYSYAYEINEYKFITIYTNIQNVYYFTNRKQCCE